MVDSGSEDKCKGVRWWREREGTASPTVTFGMWAALGMEVIPMGGRKGEEGKKGERERGQEETKEGCSTVGQSGCCCKHGGIT